MFVSYRGHWHGRIAIKMLHMDSDTDNQAQLSAFKQEVSIFTGNLNYVIMIDNKKQNKKGI